MAQRLTFDTIKSQGLTIRCFDGQALSELEVGYDRALKEFFDSGQLRPEGSWVKALSSKNCNI